MPSAAKDVTCLSRMPHGTMWSKYVEVGVDVEREAVHGAAATQAHADGRDLAVLDPHARVAVESGRTGEPEVRERVDQQLLDRAHIGDGVGHAAAPLAGHREDRIADELTRPVVGDVAAAVGTDQLRTDSFGSDEHVGGIGPHAQREDVGMLEQQQMVVGRMLEQRVLQRERIAVAHTTEPPDAQRGHGTRAPGTSRGSRVGS